MEANMRKKQMSIHLLFLIAALICMNASTLLSANDPIKGLDAYILKP
jgi:hypothetical protein